MAGVLCLVSVIPAYADDISDTKQEGNKLEERKEQLVEEQKTLTEQLTKVLEEMQEMEKKLAAKDAEIEAAEEEYVQAKLEEARQYDKMKMRIRFMYENGDSQMLEVLFEAKSFSDFINKAEYINKISSTDREMLDSLELVVKQVEEKEKRLQKEDKVMEGLQNDLTKKHVEVEKLLKEKNTQLSDLEKEIGENAKKLQELIAKAKAQEEANANKGGYTSPGSDVVSGNGIFTHPCPQGHLTSGFGYRSFDNSFHKGADFGTYGAYVPTYAAAAGKVIIAGWSNSAGNWVVIDHGNGLVTKYMHHSSLSVSVGQSVRKGQQIGITGNTGYSAGVHLHFQVEKNGSAVDPFNYL